MTDWNLKIDPARYLVRHPNGPHSDLARAILADQNQQYRAKNQQATKSLVHAIDVLVGHLGCDFHSEDRSEGEADSVPAVCRELLFNCRPRDKQFEQCWEEYARAENEFCGRMVKKHGVHLNLYGTLGPPLDVWKLPRYWKHKSHPADYLWRNTTRGKREILNLARAAVAPIEDAIDKEIVTIVNALRSRVLKPDDSYSDEVFFSVLNYAYTQILYSRYDGKHSMEHYNAIRYWFQNLDLETRAEVSQIRRAQELTLRAKEY
jgi:hypothetical protein